MHGEVREVDRARIERKPLFDRLLYAMMVVRVPVALPERRIEHEDVDAAYGFDGFGGQGTGVRCIEQLRLRRFDQIAEGAGGMGDRQGGVAHPVVFDVVERFEHVFVETVRHVVELPSDALEGKRASVRRERFLRHELHHVLEFAEAPDVGEVRMRIEQPIEGFHPFAVELVADVGRGVDDEPFAALDHDAAIAAPRTRIAPSLFAGGAFAEKRRPAASGARP